MKRIMGTIAISSALLLAGGAQAATDASAQLEESGTIQRMLMNPEGAVDGFILDGGRQVNFPPHMSAGLTAVAAAKDKVKVAGFRQNARVFKAETVTNVKTGKSVTETPPADRLDLGPPGPGPGPRGEGPRGPGNPPGRRDRLTQLSAEGTVEQQLYGKHGEVNGVVLSTGAIVHFRPRMLDDSKVRTAVGQKIRANGFGTKTELGESIEATELSNS